MLPGAGDDSAMAVLLLGGCAGHQAIILTVAFDMLRRMIKHVEFGWGRCMFLNARQHGNRNFLVNTHHS